MSGVAIRGDDAAGKDGGRETRAPATLTELGARGQGQRRRCRHRDRQRQRERERAGRAGAGGAGRACSPPYRPPARRRHGVARSSPSLSSGRVQMPRARVEGRRATSSTGCVLVKGSGGEIWGGGVAFAGVGFPRTSVECAAIRGRKMGAGWGVTPRESEAKESWQVDYVAWHVAGVARGRGTGREREREKERWRRRRRRRRVGGTASSTPKSFCGFQLARARAQNTPSSQLGRANHRPRSPYCNARFISGPQNAR